MPPSQNIFDNETFFEGYRQLRARPDSSNTLLEQPAMRSLLPPLKDQRVLDLGCGMGDNCAEFIEHGAREVLGVDLSEKMLAVALDQNAPSAVQYQRLDMNDLSPLLQSPGRFDLVYSSLAVHYVEDFSKWLEQVHALLYEGGRLVFSQEHPLVTAPMQGARWEKSPGGQALFYPLTDYSRPGERCVSWFVDGIQKYHRTFAQIFNALAQSGFALEQCLEPTPDRQAIEIRPAMADEFHRPNFLLVRARRI